nr:colipase-like protein 2 [Vicugna pacos]
MGVGSGGDHLRDPPPPSPIARELVTQGLSPQTTGARCFHHSECFSDCCPISLNHGGAFCAPKARVAMMCLPQEGRGSPFRHVGWGRFKTLTWLHPLFSPFACSALPRSSVKFLLVLQYNCCQEEYVVLVLTMTVLNGAWLLLAGGNTRGTINIICPCQRGLSCTSKDSFCQTRGTELNNHMPLPERLELHIQGLRLCLPMPFDLEEDANWSLPPLPPCLGTRGLRGWGPLLLKRH